EEDALPLLVCLEPYLDQHPYAVGVQLLVAEIRHDRRPAPHGERGGGEVERRDPVPDRALAEEETADGSIIRPALDDLVADGQGRDDEQDRADAGRESAQPPWPAAVRGGAGSLHARSVDARSVDARSVDAHSASRRSSTGTTTRARGPSSHQVHSLRKTKLVRRYVAPRNSTSISAGTTASGLISQMK